MSSSRMSLATACSLSREAVSLLVLYFYDVVEEYHESKYITKKLILEATFFV